MSYCDNCLHRKVCGLENVGDEAMTYCCDKMGLILVSERLPEEDDEYLICFDNGELNLDYYCRGSFSYSGVIAWMPLPRLY